MATRASTCEITYEAFKKKARGKLSLACSSRRNTGGRIVNKAGFMVARHKKITTTPRRILSVALSSPTVSNRNGFVEGIGSSMAKPVNA